MEFILDLIRNIRSSDLITFIALILAYSAYNKSILNKYESVKVLVYSLKKELDAQSNWLSTSYNMEYENKDFFSPNAIIYKLSFESAKEIARRGISEDKLLKKDFGSNIALFNERIDAFNTMLDYQRDLITTNPVLSGLLYDRLYKFGLEDKRVSLNEFRNSINKLKNCEDEKYIDENKKIYFLAFELRKINKSIYNLIGNSANNDHLHKLWQLLDSASNDLLKNYKKCLPLYVHYKGIIIIIAIIIFFTIENFLK